MALGSYPHETNLILGWHVRRVPDSISLLRTPSFSDPLTSSKPACTLSTILPITLAYFFPCSPSKTTPEWRMILTWSPRESRRYPRTERCEDNRARVCSSSGGILVVDVCVLVPVMFVFVGTAIPGATCMQVGQWNEWKKENQTIVSSGSCSMVQPGL